MRSPEEGAPPLILLGGTLCDAALWQPVRERLPVSDVRCVTVRGARSAQAMAERLLATLPPRFLLGGFSLGAIVALHMQATAPQRLAGLALLSVNPFADRPENAVPRRRALEEARRAGLAAYVSQTLWPRYVAPRRLADSALRRTIAGMAERCGAQVFAEQTDIAIYRDDCREALGRLRVPVTIISGDDDPICTPRHHGAVAQAAPGARWHALPGCGHFVPLEAPDRTAAALYHWITEAQLCDSTR